MPRRQPAPETTYPRDILPRDNMPPRQCAPETTRPGDNMPWETICPGRQYAPGDNVPRKTMCPGRQCAPETICPGRQHAPKTLYPGRQCAPEGKNSQRKYALEKMCPRHEKSRKHASIACGQFLRKMWTFLDKLQNSGSTLKLMSTALHYDQ